MEKLKSFSEGITTEGAIPTKTEGKVRPFSEGINTEPDEFGIRITAAKKKEEGDIAGLKIIPWVAKKIKYANSEKIILEIIAKYRSKYPNGDAFMKGLESYINKGVPPFYIRDMFRRWFEMTDLPALGIDDLKHIKKFFPSFWKKRDTICLHPDTKLFQENKSKELKSFSETISTGSANYTESICYKELWEPYDQGVKNAAKRGFSAQDVNDALTDYLENKPLTKHMKEVLTAAWPEFFAWRVGWPTDPKVTFDQIIKDFKSHYPGTVSELKAGVQKAKKLGWSLYDTHWVLNVWFMGELDHISSEDKKVLKSAFPELFEKSSEAPKNTIPKGNYYHPSVGWY